jgi:hypothetical protein
VLLRRIPSPACPTKHQAPALPRLRRLHLHRHPQRRQHGQHFADLRGRLARFKVNDEPQPDIGDAGGLVLPQLLRLAAKSPKDAQLTGWGRCPASLFELRRMGRLILRSYAIKKIGRIKLPILRSSAGAKQDRATPHSAAAPFSRSHPTGITGRQRPICW